MTRRRIPSPATMLTLLPLLLGANAAAWGAVAKKDAPPPEPKPAASIPVRPLGFEPPSLFYMSVRPSEVTLDFIDPHHLLFTFRVNGLLKRKPGDHAGDEDQLIRADVLDIATGKVVRQAQWTMHDHNRYLWALPDGKFLIREQNALYLTDSSLQLQTWQISPLPLILVTLSPDRKLIAVEREEPADTPSLAPTVDLKGNLLDRPLRIGITVYRTGTRKILFNSESPRPVMLPLIQSGFLQVLEDQNSNNWIVRRVTIHPAPDGSKPAQIARKDVFTLHSKCNPSLLPLSDAVAIAGCAGDGQDHPMTVLNLDGKPLWSQWWQGRYVWHTLAYAESGSRFALASLITDHPYASTTSISAQSIQGQIVGVFDTASGKLVLVRDAQPIVSAGQNFALSANGRRFALLRQQAIEVYNLPPVTSASATSAVAATKKH